MSKYSQMATRIARKPRMTSAEPRKPPSQARAKATVDAILDATARILAEDGFEAVNTNRVAEVAGVSVGSLYQYFPNKASLVGAVAVRHTEAMAAVIAAGVHAAADDDLPSLVKALMEIEPRIRFSVSYTTRKPRPNEIPGRDYHFVSMERFAEMAAHGEFLEHAQVFDNCYGTGVRTVEEALANGEQLLLEIDWQGAAQVRARLPEARSIFILPPSRGSLAQRLKARSTDTDTVIQRRLDDAARDIAQWSEFEYVVINDRFERALEDLLAIVEDRGSHLIAQRPEVVRLASELLQPV